MPPRINNSYTYLIHGHLLMVLRHNSQLMKHVYLCSICRTFRRVGFYINNPRQQYVSIITNEFNHLQLRLWMSNDICQFTWVVMVFDRLIIWKLSIVSSDGKECHPRPSTVLGFEHHCMTMYTVLLFATHQERKPIQLKYQNQLARSNVIRLFRIRSYQRSIIRRRSVRPADIIVWFNSLTQDILAYFSAG